MQFLRQSTAGQEILLGPFLDDTDGKTAETGLTIANTDIKLWKEGGTSESNKNSGGATHIASGRYYCVLDATDTNTLGNLEVNVHVAGALPVRRAFVVLAANVYDSLIAASDKLEVDNVQFGGVNGAYASGRPEVNAVQISGDGPAADALEAMLDGTGGVDISLRSIVIYNNAGAGVEIAGDTIGLILQGNTGEGLQIASSAGTGLSCTSSGVGNHAAIFYASDGHGIQAVGTGTGNSGLSLTGGTGGFGLAGSISGNITGNLSGSVGSVTGAVASVTGNVGGNVVGSVASVTGNVGGSVASVVGNVGGNVVGSVASVTGNVGGSVASVTNMVTANAVEISGDSIAADRLETMLDGTGGNFLTLSGILLDARSGAPSYGGLSAAIRIVTDQDANGTIWYSMTDTTFSGVIKADAEEGINVFGGVFHPIVTTVQTVSDSVGSIAAGGITTASFANGALTAVKVAADVNSAIAAAVRTNLTTELARIDVTTSTRLAAASYVAPPTAADINTVLSAAHGAGSWEGGGGGGGGTGTHLVTVTVTDGTNPLENATVLVHDGVTPLSQLTNEDGNATFALDAATYTVGANKAGYAHTPESRTVTGHQAGTIVNELVMTAVTIPAAPADADVCRVYGYIETPNNLPAVNVEIHFDLVADAGARAERLLAGRRVTVKTDSLGRITSKDADGNTLLYVDLQRNDRITPGGTTWKVTCEEMEIEDQTITLNASTYDLVSLVP
jgi:hypothetical protein